MPPNAEQELGAPGIERMLPAGEKRFRIRFLESQPFESGRGMGSFGETGAAWRNAERGFLSDSLLHRGVGGF